MLSQNFLYYSLAIGFLILVGFISYTAFSMSKTLRRLTSILEKVDDVTKDLDDFKNFIKQGIIYLMNLFVEKGGEKHGKQK